MYLTVIFSALTYATKRHLKLTGGLLSYLFIYSEIFLDGSYDYILPEKNKPSVIFDIGGNIGLYTLYLNEKYDHLEIHSFEPVPDLFHSLKHNVLTNKKPANKIYPNNLGLSNKKETVTINYFPNASGFSTVQSDLEFKAGRIKSVFVKGGSIVRGILNAIASILIKTNFVAKPVKVNLIRVSDYITDHKIENIDIFKLDVEGYELQVMQGIDNRHFSQIHSFQIEIENYRKDNQAKIIALLRKHNYKISVEWANDSWSFVVAVRKGPNEPKISQHKQRFPILKP